MCQSPSENLVFFCFFFWAPIGPGYFRSGAGVGVGILRGTLICLEIAKIHKFDRPKIPRFHTDPKIFKNDQYSPKHIFDLLGVIYVLGFPQLFKTY